MKWLLALGAVTLAYVYAWSSRDNSPSGAVPSGTIAMVPTGANVTFADGHVETLDADESVVSLRQAGAVSFFFNGVSRTIA